MARKKASLDFEQSLADLQALVERLENGELSLEESLAAFEQGVDCLSHRHVDSGLDGGFAEDGNFKRGRFSPVSILVGVLLVLGGAGAIWLGVKQESQKMSVEAVAKEKKNIFVLPQKDQIPLWRKWAAVATEPQPCV